MSNVENIEIDFDDGCCKKTFNSQISYIQKQLYSYRNSYVGNKRKIIDKILCAINENGFEYDTVLDLFAGSGYVSAAFKMLNKKVISNDILNSSYVNLLAVIENNNFFINEDIINILNNKYWDFSDINIGDFGNNYFTEKELYLIHNSIYNLKKWYNENPSKKRFYQTSLIYSSLQNYIGEKCFLGGRLNNGQVLANLEHRLKHKKNKMQEMSFRKIKLNFPIESDRKCEVYNEDAIELLDYLDNINKKIDLCYIDPPYGGSQSDYFKMYSFFEQLFNNFELDKIFNKSQHNINFSEHTNRFINNKEYKNNFNILCDKIKNIPYIVISYNDSSWADIHTIIDIIKKYRDKVKVEDFDYKYQYRNSFKNSKEYLILIY